MNRFKKELRKKGFKLECDYPFLPYDVNAITVEGVTVDSTQCLLLEHYNVGTSVQGFDRQMQQHLVTFY